MPVAQASQLRERILIAFQTQRGCKNASQAVAKSAPAVSRYCSSLSSASVHVAERLSGVFPFSPLAVTLSLMANFSRLLTPYADLLQSIFAALTGYRWPQDLQPLVDAIQAKTRSSILALLSRAYSSITVQKAATFLGLSTTEVVKGKQPWSAGD